MKFVDVLAAAACLTTVFASPTPITRGNGVTLTPRRSGIERRRATSRTLGASEVSHAEPNTNWGGAVLIGSDFNIVTGTFTVITPEIPAGATEDDQYIVSTWVGLDGETCYSAIWQAGVDAVITNGTIEYRTWYEWYPEASYYYDGFNVSAGDVINVTITADSSTSGAVTIDNLSTGQNVASSVADLPPSEALCETNAEWIIETMEPWIRFGAWNGNITFTDTYATVANGSVYGSTGSDIYEIVWNGQGLTSCSAGSDGVTCAYMG